MLWRCRYRDREDAFGTGYEPGVDWSYMMDVIEHFMLSSPHTITMGDTMTSNWIAALPIGVL